MKFLGKWWHILKTDKLLQKILANSGYLLSSNVLSMGLSMSSKASWPGACWAWPVFGVVGTITAFASTLNRLFSFRMNELVVKYFGEARSHNQPERAAAVVKICRSGRNRQRRLLSFLILYADGPHRGRALGRRPQPPRRLFILYGSMVLANFATETSTGVLQATNKFRNYAVVNLISSIHDRQHHRLGFLHPTRHDGNRVGLPDRQVRPGAGHGRAGLHEMNRAIGKGWWKTSFSHLPPFKELFSFAFSSNISSTIIMLVRDNEALWIALFLSPVEVGYAKVCAGHHQPGADPHHPIHFNHLSGDQPGGHPARLDPAAAHVKTRDTHLRHLDRRVRAGSGSCWGAGCSPFMAPISSRLTYPC